MWENQNSMRSSYQVMLKTKNPNLRYDFTILTTVLRAKIRSNLAVASADYHSRRRQVPLCRRSSCRPSRQVRVRLCWSPSLSAIRPESGEVISIENIYVQCDPVLFLRLFLLINLCI